MANLNDLARRMEKRKRNFQKHVSDVTKNVAKAVIFSLIENTPVDTSKAVSNWVATVGSKAVSEIAAHVEGKYGSTAEQSRQIAKKLALEAIKNYVAGKGQSIWISNLADYIVHLDKGTITRAPLGFTNQALIVGRTVVGISNVKMD